MPSNKVRTRFAPSPTGYMHVGNLRTALYTYLMAKHEDGTFILRIEDTDQGRYVEGAVDVIYNTLRETGLLWDEGPDIGGPVGPYVQSERMGMFKQYAEQLVAEGKAYYCFCTEERLEALHAEQRANGEMTHYDGCCRDLPEEEVKQRLAAGEPYVIRQKIPKEGVTGFDDVVYGHIEVENSEMDDQILIKTDGMPTYNFANVVDDPDGHHPCHPRQRVSVLHPQVQPAVSGLWLGDPHLYPLPTRDEGRAEQAVQAQR